MTQAVELRDSVDAGRLLAEAARIVRNQPYCWLATSPEAGGVRVRPMGKISFNTDAWTIHFITDGRSRKASDLRRTHNVSVVCGREADDAYIALIGTARCAKTHPRCASDGRAPITPISRRNWTRKMPSSSRSASTVSSFGSAALHRNHLECTPRDCGVTQAAGG